MIDNFAKLQFILGKITEINDEPRIEQGAPETEVRALLESLDLQPDPLLVRLYTQHDGIEGLDAFLRFLPLKDVAFFHSQFRSIKDRDPDFEWEPQWMPIFDMNADVQICLDTRAGSLMAIDMEGGTVTTMAAHYQQCIDALYDIFSSGHYIFDPESGSIELDASTWRALAAKYEIVGIDEIW